MTRVALRRGELENEHVLGQPTLVASHNRSNTQSEALLTQQGVSAIARTVGPNLAGFGEVNDVLGVAAGPSNIGLTFRQRCSHCVQGGTKVAVFADQVKCGAAHARHDAHVDNNVRTVGDFDTELRNT